MNDNLNKKYKKKEKRAEKLERFFGKVFRGSCLTLMGCILLRYAPHFFFFFLARAGIIISEGAILASVVGEFTCSMLKDRYDNKAYHVEQEQNKPVIQSEETSRDKELVRVETHEDYREEQRTYGEYDVFSRSRPAVRQRRRK